MSPVEQGGAWAGGGGEGGVSWLGRALSKAASLQSAASKERWLSLSTDRRSSKTLPLLFPLYLSEIPPVPSMDCKQMIKYLSGSLYPLASDGLSTGSVIIRLILSD